MSEEQDFTGKMPVPLKEHIMSIINPMATRSINSGGIWNPIPLKVLEKLNENPVVAWSDGMAIPVREKARNLLDIKPGESFSIFVKDNPSTGYHWEVDTKAIKGIFNVRDTFYGSPDPDVEGAGGVRKFTFDPKVASTDDFVPITLIKYPPGSPEAAHGYTMEVFIGEPPIAYSDKTVGCFI
ncbi:MAG: protease inhibitor I42 family protein [Armatimonadetes bacterium]|nr:protease inhibitor I42 family protein [Armatimonadota bacterium]